MERSAPPRVVVSIPFEAGPSLRNVLHDTCYIAWHPQAWLGLVALGFAFGSWALSPAIASKMVVLFLF